MSDAATVLVEECEAALCDELIDQLLERPRALGHALDGRGVGYRLLDRGPAVVRRANGWGSRLDERLPEY